jgi:uncharacterized OsmC-like protein
MATRARVVNRQGEHQVTVSSHGSSRSIEIPPKATGFGSSVNGGELLVLALATCYCNDLYREAVKRGIEVQQVEVEVEGEFGGEGEPASWISYHASVVADTDEPAILDLIRHTDTVAEIQNTLRTSTPVKLDRIEAVSRSS